MYLSTSARALKPRWHADLRGVREPLWQGFPASAASDENVGMNCPPPRDCTTRRSGRLGGGTPHLAGLPRYDVDPARSAQDHDTNVDRQIPYQPRSTRSLKAWLRLGLGLLSPL